MIRNDINKINIRIKKNNLFKNTANFYISSDLNSAIHPGQGNR